MVIKSVALIVIGLAGGLAVGSGFVAFLTVLGIIPRLTQLTKTGNMIRFYEWAVISGAVVAVWIGLRDLSFHLFTWIMVPIGLFCGTFVGMLAAALTEVLNVMPILSKRVGVDGKILMLLMAIVLGKICGSLFQWLYFIND
ncbi:stage V sporulation protein AB [Lederbergia citrea]|uniref:Stage V sporulation protein AB n=1 Tax=Lederbergia citrea TaxID=2833581 RepID=A0A942UIY8_9BACI|nr:stage V sporulation protein AB [Lederbergia citrea]MBS4203018.1 stage V sporulation protein AB [Lederbergia citrea]MBS4222310.1 stage V sporulation protein AB [Lederbergia citrea]